MLPDCEHMKWFSVKLWVVKTMREKVSIGPTKNLREVGELNWRGTKNIAAIKTVPID